MSSRNRLYHLFKSVPFTEKRPRRPETGIKDGFEGMEHEFPFGIFHPEKQDYIFRCQFRCSRKVPVGKTQKVAFHLLSNRISRKIFVNGKQPLLCYYLRIFALVPNVNYIVIRLSFY